VNRIDRNRDIKLCMVAGGMGERNIRTLVCCRQDPVTSAVALFIYMQVISVS
jgi:hypothetical protein